MREILLTSSVLILALALLRRLLRGRISLRLQYALWLLVALRLLVPVSIGHSAISLLNWTEGKGAYEAASPGEDPGTAVPAVPAAPGLLEVPQPVPGGPAGEAPAAASPVRKGGSWLTWVWLAGCAGMAAWFFAVNLRFRRRAKAGAKPLKADCPLPVWVSSGVPSPCLVGLVRPRIYLTPACLDSPDSFHHVLAHEEVHWRHKDPWWALVRGLCLCLYWFDPLVWWAADLSRRDGELACDEGAIRRLGEGERLAYGRTLVALAAVTVSPARLLQTATTMADRRHGLKERVLLIAKKPRMAAAAVLCLLLAVGVVVGCAFTGAEEERTLQERLLDLPEELAGRVEAEEDAEDPDHLVSYRAPAYAGGGEAEWAGWLLDVYRMTPGGFERTFYASDGSGWHAAARTGDAYYAFRIPTDVQWAPEFSEELQTLQEELAVWTWEQILAEEGAELFTDGEVRAVRSAAFTYPGAHRWPEYYPYLASSGSYEGAMTLTLSQPVKQGDGGVWCVERWSDGSSTYLWYPPDTDLAAADYYAQLQAQADAGEADWALDPHEVALQMVRQWYSGNDTYTVAEDSLVDDHTVDHLEEYDLWVFPSWEKEYLEDGSVVEDGLFEIMGQKVVPFTEEKEAYSAYPESDAVMATGMKYLILAAYGETERCDAMEAQPVDESALVNQPLYNRRPNYIHAPERLADGAYRLCFEYLLADQSGDTPPEERQRAELEIVEQDGQYLVRRVTLS